MKRFLLLKVLAISFFTYAQISPNGEINDQVISSWAKANEEVAYHNFIVIPENVSPGYVKVSLTQGDKDLRPALVISRDLNKGGAIISGSSAQTNNELHRTAYFSVHPGMTYSVMVRPFFNAKQYPIKYNLSWQFFERKDIYEPNDTREEAKQINLNEEIEAYGISGYIKNYYIASNDSNTYDWYKVVLDSDQELKVKVLQKPTDLNLVLRLYNDKGAAIGIKSIRETSEHDIKSSATLKKGTYYISTYVRMKGPRISNNDTKPIPDHYNTPYKLIVTNNNHNVVDTNNNNSSDAQNDSNTSVIEDSSLEDLQGVWIRKESNNPKADGIEVEVSGTKGIIIDKASSNFAVGHIKWSSISKKALKTFSYKELGSDNNYYNATIKFITKGKLEVRVGHSGAGNSQTWIRKGTEDAVNTVTSDLLALEGRWRLNASNGGSYDGMVINVKGNTAKIISTKTRSNYKKETTKWKGIIQGDGNEYAFTDIDHNGTPTFAVIRKKDNDVLKVSLAASVAGNEQTWQRVKETDEIETPPTATVSRELPCQITENMTLVDTPAEVDYVVKENCVIDLTATLTIEPDVVIEFETDAGISLKGSGFLNLWDGVILRGKEAKQGYWRGIHIDSDDSELILSESKILHAGSKSVYCCNEEEKAAINIKRGKLSVVKNGTVIGMSGGCGIKYESIDPDLNGTLDYGMNSIKFRDNKDGDVCIEPEILSGTISENRAVTLIKKRGPNEVDYRVSGVYNVEGLLEIKEGVIVEFEKEAGINVVRKGKISMQGRENNKIILRGKQAEKGYWRNILINNSDKTDENIFSHVEISGTGSDVDATFFTNTPVYIKRGTLVADGLIMKNHKRSSDPFGSCWIFSEYDGRTAGENFGWIGDGWRNCRMPQRLPNEITEDLTIRGGGSPYATHLIDGETNVRSNLIIEPGVKILATKGSSLNILDDANLTINGPINGENVSIRGKEGAAGYWKGININTNGQTYIRKAYIANGGSAPFYNTNLKAGIYLKKGKLNLEKANLSNNQGCAVYVDPEHQDNISDFESRYSLNTEGDFCIEPRELPCQITEDTVLYNTPAEVDYVVKEDCVIDVTARLDIHPGVVVEFEKDAGLGINKNGQLMVYSSGKTAPILRGKKNEEGYWRGIHIETERLGHFSDMKILNAGSKSVYYGQKKAAIYVKKGELFFYHNTIGNSGGCGLYLDPSNTYKVGYGSNTFFDNNEGDLCVDPKILSGNVSGGLTLSKIRGVNEVDYRVKGVYNVGGKLTIEKGVIIEFEQDAGISAVAGGEITIEGTQDSNVTLRGQEARQGYWRGLYLSGDVRHNFQHVKIEHAGSRPVFGGSTISGIHLFDGFLNLENSTITNSAGCGIFVSRKGTLDESNNSFNNNKNGNMCSESNN